MPANTQLLQTETVGQGTAPVSPVIERITRPTVTEQGRKAPALRFGDLRVQALAGALANMLFAVTGITNKHPRVLMTDLPNRPYRMACREIGADGRPGVPGGDLGGACEE
jgi:hypothetical protein